MIFIIANNPITSHPKKPQIPIQTHQNPHNPKRTNPKTGKASLSARFRSFFRVQRTGSSCIKRSLPPETDDVMTDDGALSANGRWQRVVTVNNETDARMSAGKYRVECNCFFFIFRGRRTDFDFYGNAMMIFFEGSMVRVGNLNFSHIWLLRVRFKFLTYIWY